MKYPIKDGDIIATSAPGFVSGVINLSTFGLPYPLAKSGASHVGIVCKDGPQAMVFESTTVDRPPCIYQGDRIRGCQAHRLDDYMKFSKGALHVYPLRRELYPEEKYRLERILSNSLGKKYDMLGATRSGGFAYRLLQSMLHDEDTSTLFCSEFLASVLVEIGVMHTRHVSKWNPNSLVRYLVRHGVCDKPERLEL